MKPNGYTSLNIEPTILCISPNYFSFCPKLRALDALSKWSRQDERRSTRKRRLCICSCRASSLSANEYRWTSAEMYFRSSPSWDDQCGRGKWSRSVEWRGMTLLFRIWRSISSTRWIRNQITVGSIMVWMVNSHQQQRSLRYHHKAILFRIIITETPVLCRWVLTSARHGTLVKC